MKKMILTSLFSATLLFGSFGTTVFADEVVPTDDSSTPPIEVPTDPSTPTEPTEPTSPVDPPVDPVEPPVTPTDPVEPTEPSEPEKPVDPVEPTEPSKPEEPVDPAEPEKPSEPEKPVEPTQPTEPEKPVEPIDTTPSPQQPVQSEGGQTIIGVDNGNPIIQEVDGTTKTVTPESIGATKQADGSLLLKDSSGKIKVLPKMGEVDQAILSVAGSVMMTLAGFFLVKRNRKRI